MKTIFNFSHSLGTKATEQITQAIGVNQVFNIRVQLDLSQALPSQVFELCRAAKAEHGQPDYLLPPGLAPAAILIDRYFSKLEDDYPPCVTYVPTIRLVMENGTTPPVFVLAEIWER